MHYEGLEKIPIVGDINTDDLKTIDMMNIINSKNE